jgi:hypothetical protein
MATARSRRALDKMRDEELDRAPAATPKALPRAEGILNAIVPQNDMDGYVREIRRLWLEARSKFMAIGEYLMQAKRTLPHGEYEAMIRARLPFNTSAAHKMRAVAEAVHDGRVPREKLPNSYATAYELTLLDDEELRIAEARSLVRPDVFLREIQALRAELRAPVGPQRRAALARERERIHREIERLRGRLGEIDKQLRAEERAGVEPLTIDSQTEPVGATV